VKYGSLVLALSFVCNGARTIKATWYVSFISNFESWKNYLSALTETEWEIDSHLLVERV
jgi:hypothetical protein